MRRLRKRYSTHQCPCSSTYGHPGVVPVGRLLRSWRKLDVDGNGSTPVTYGVTSIPTLLLFKGGELVEQIKGAVPKQRIVDTIQNLVE